jgi:hypothetical protein
MNGLLAFAATGKTSRTTKLVDDCILFLKYSTVRGTIKYQLMSICSGEQLGVYSATLDIS